MGAYSVLKVLRKLCCRSKRVNGLLEMSENGVEKMTSGACQKNIPERIAREAIDILRERFIANWAQTTELMCRGTQDGTFLLKYAAVYHYG